MPIRITVYLPEGAAERVTVPDDGALSLGRDPSCGVIIDHPSVSRRHAELRIRGQAWSLSDLGSKNGTFIEGVPARSQERTASAWVRLGDVACEIASITPDAANRAMAENHRKREAATAVTVALGASASADNFLQMTIDSIVTLAGAERGMLLVPTPEGWQPAVGCGFPKSSLGHLVFDGSSAAVKRAASTGSPVVLHDLTLDAELAGRESVASGGLRALASIPLTLEADVVGIAYADSKAPGATITRLDLELLEAFAERAALWMATRRQQQVLAGTVATRIGR